MINRHFFIFQITMWQMAKQTFIELRWKQLYNLSSLPRSWPEVGKISSNSFFNRAQCQNFGASDARLVNPSSKDHFSYFIVRYICVRPFFLQHTASDGSRAKLVDDVCGCLCHWDTRPSAPGHVVSLVLQTENEFFIFFSSPYSSWLKKKPRVKKK